MKAKSLTMGAAALAVAVGVGVLGSGSSGNAQPYRGGYGMMGMMGGYGMGPGMMFGGGAANQPVYPGWGGGVLDYQQTTAYLKDGDQNGTVDRGRNTITYGGRNITINMVAVEPGHRDQTFEVRGLTNPTLVVPLGATVHLNLVNMDFGNNMEHGVIITPAPPPYRFMTMMAPGLAGVMPLLPWRSHKSIEKARYASLGATFVAREPGVYWYICPTPEHAEKGMYGKFVVR